MMDDFENQLDKIRLVIYEQTKDMHNAETVKAVNDYGKVLAAKYGITSIPTTILFVNGEEKNTNVGMLPKSKYIEILGL